MTFARHGAHPHRGFPSWLDAVRWSGGANLLWGGIAGAAGATAASQVVDVGGSTAAIDGGRATARLSAELGGALAVTDSMTATASFLGAGGADLGGLSVGPVTAEERRSQTTLLGAAVALTGEGMSEVALLVLATTLLFPLLQLCILLYLLLPVAQGRRLPGFALLVRIMQSLRPWGMIEVFLLGVLVAIVKLSSMASVVAGPALWAFVALTVLLTAVLSFDPRLFWQAALAPPEPGTAEAAPVVPDGRAA